jgi:FkbM family methyltransferase
MSSFKEVLKTELVNSWYNHYGNDNYDQHRFGQLTEPMFSGIHILKAWFKRLVKYNQSGAQLYVNKVVDKWQPYLDGLDLMYSSVSESDKQLLVKLIAYRILGYKKVKLPTNNQAYWQALNQVRRLKSLADTYRTNFNDFVLEKFDLTPIGYPVNFYFRDPGVVHDFLLEQYAYKVDRPKPIQAEPGDVVLDVGGCWGDTALYFANKVGPAGKVYSFEFIPGNLKIFNLNMSFNPDLVQRIDIIQHPVSNVSDQVIYFKDNGPGSRIEQKPFADQTGSTTTLSIDDFVTRNNVTQVDFIKMDIEGAEPFALQGAIETIKKYKPTLAIAIYHSMEDFIHIPKWILDLNLGYELAINHYTIHTEETICFAKVKSK